MASGKTGRPRNDERGRNVSVYGRVSEVRLWSEAAESAGQYLSQWLRQAANERAKAAAK